MNSAAFRFILKTSEHGLITQEQSMMCHLAVSVVNENSGDFRWRSAQILQEFAPARTSHSHRHPTIIGEAAGFEKTEAKLEADRTAGDKNGALGESYFHG